jgi:hypothetical protein
MSQILRFAKNHACYFSRFNWWFSFLSFAHQHLHNQQHLNTIYNSSTVANTMANQSTRPSSSTSRRYGVMNCHRDLSPILSTTSNSANGNNGVDRVIAILDAALEIVGESSVDVVLSCSDEFSDSITNDDTASKW